MIELASVTEKARLVDPWGKAMEQVIEHRTDPLTGCVASINAALGEKARAFLGSADVELLASLQEKTKQGCPFCGVAEKGTRFPPDLVAEGQLRSGRAVAVPNLFSKAGFDAVAIVDPARHVLFPAQLEAEALADAVRISSSLVQRARALDAAWVHHAVGMNFLAPGGSSVPHPHFQVHVRGVPYSALSRVLSASLGFLQRTGRSYWDALVSQEKDGPRFIGSTGRVQWLAPWAPAHQREVWGVLPGVASIAALSSDDAQSFATGIARVVSAYEAMGSHPFTFAFFSSPGSGDAKHFALQVRICSRPAFRSLYSNYDTWFTPKFFGDDVHLQSPEELAEKIRGHLTDLRPTA